MIITKGSFFCHFYKDKSFMMRFKNLFIKIFIIFNLLEAQISFADNHNIYETLELIQKDIKTFEKAVYSGSVEIKNNSSAQQI